MSSCAFLFLYRVFDCVPAFEQFQFETWVIVIEKRALRLLRRPKQMHWHIHCWRSESATVAIKALLPHRVLETIHNEKNVVRSMWAGDIHAKAVPFDTVQDRGDVSVALPVHLPVADPPGILRCIIQIRVSRNISRLGTHSLHPRCLVPTPIPHFVPHPTIQIRKWTLHQSAAALRS